MQIGLKYLVTTTKEFKCLQQSIVLSIEQIRKWQLIHTSMRPPEVSKSYSQEAIIPFNVHELKFTIQQAVFWRGTNFLKLFVKECVLLTRGSLQTASAVSERWQKHWICITLWLQCQPIGDISKFSGLQNISPGNLAQNVGQRFYACVHPGMLLFWASAVKNRRFSKNCLRL